MFAWAGDSPLSKQKRSGAWLYYIKLSFGGIEFFKAKEILDIEGKPCIMS
jgi:hypothetical protein